jgi:hypothetical protein
MLNLVRDGGLDNFLTWPVVTQALHARYSHISKKERMHLPDKLRHLAVDLSFPPAPGPVSPEGASGTYIKQTILLFALEMDFLGVRGVERLSHVYEVGGGYGAMAVMLTRMGFAGTHTVLDLPALHIIRDWYLGDDILVDTADWPGECEVDLFIAIHSLDEMPVITREEILSSVIAKHYIFSFTKEYDGVDNSGWFRNWCIDQKLIFRDLWPWMLPNQDMIIAERV